MRKIELFCESKECVYSKTAYILASEGIDGATFTKTAGLWQGDFEDSFKVEIVGSWFTETKAQILAQALARTFNQEAVLYLFTEDAGTIRAKLVQQDGKLLDV